MTTLSFHGEALPADALVHGYESSEAISSPYAAEVEFSTEDAAFRADACLRTRMLLAITDARGTVRHMDGVVDRAGFAFFTGTRVHFKVRLRPALAALEHREGSRIFQGKSSVDVVKEVLADAGVDEKVEWQLTGSYQPRELVVQYRETELNFVHRLLEDEGIFYWFRHDADGHTLVLADHVDAFSEHEGLPPVHFGLGQGIGPGTQPLGAFTRKRSLRTTSVLLRDYDFEKPQYKPVASVPAEDRWPMPFYEYPGGFTQDADGSRRAKARLSELRRDADVCEGESSAVGLACGAPVLVEGAAEPWLNGEFVIVELGSSGAQTPGGRADNAACKNAFKAVPRNAAFAAPRRARRPRIRGLQTAVVTGPANEEQAIHVDKYGRIKVRFLWDRAGKQDDTSSCWLRVAQLAMGGAMILPRVGWEVSVAFLDGDPDRSVVVGRVYNAEKQRPYGLPDSAADGSLKSMASPGGAGHNEIKMGDSAGKQGMSISAQKDLNTAIGNDKNETIAVDETHSVGSNMKVTIGSNETVAVGANQTIDVGNALQVTVGAAQSITVGGSETLTTKADFVESVGGSRGYSVGGNQITISNGVRTEATGALTRDVGSVQVTASVATISDDNLAAFDETAGAVIVHLVAGTSGETVAAGKKLTSTAAELHLASDWDTTAAGVTQLVGGVHLRKVGGDFSVSAPTIMLVGGVGQFKGGGSSVKLSGGPVVIKGSKIAIDAASVVKLGSSLKLG